MVAYREDWNVELVVAIALIEAVCDTDSMLPLQATLKRTASARSTPSTWPTQ